MIEEYYRLTKPGIIFGNALPSIAGFFLASKGSPDWLLLIETLVGISLIIASACVFNNCMDLAADGQMARTRNRPLVRGAISLKEATVFGVALGFSGIVTLAFFTNLLVLLLAMMGMFVYLVLYTILKYHTWHNTLIGSVAGSMPPLVGYCAVSHELDMGALLLFLLLTFWQMPHFFAIALYRSEEFAAASIRTLPLEKGSYVTKVQMIGYIVAFLATNASLTFFGFTGFLYFFVSFGLGMGWLWLALRGFRAEREKKWAREMFVYSLQTIFILSCLISINAFL